MKEKAAWRDPLVEEVRKHGQEYAAKFDFDPHKMGEDLRRLQKESGKPVVSFSHEDGGEDAEPSQSPRRRTSRS
ncbi:MAG TPA: hypothetical protein VIA62_23695 [Thermoanaerobaculia bacterium]|nr:hypothetical protein [Thermoanaerobaculia bacterium]